MGITQAILAGMASLAELCLFCKTPQLLSRIENGLPSGHHSLKEPEQVFVLGEVQSLPEVPVVAADHDVTVVLLHSPTRHAHHTNIFIRDQRIV